MKHRIYLTVALCMFCSMGFSQNPPKREFRAAWLATYGNIDWPSSGATSAQEQSTFIQRVEEHRLTGMNALFVQVRSQCDAMYPSPYEPWSADLTGTQGTAPSPYYDPLEFMITETRKRGMEFHAWFNPYRALGNATTSTLAALHSSHVINQHPEWIMTAGSQRILNPGIPAVWDYVIKVVMDVVRRYDIDGVHFDDYFYPYPSAGTYTDDAEYALYGRGISTKAAWRRSNVDSLVKRLGDSIRAEKPWVKFGISPSGIWLSQASDAVNGSNTSSGATQHYKDLYANSRLWQQQGWVDYLAPQIYWYMGQSGSDYSILIPWWNNNAFGRHIYSGMAGYKVGDAAQNAAFATDNRQVPNQVRLNRQSTAIAGQIVYNTTSLRNNKLGFTDSLKLLFSKPALQPTMAWKDNTAPAAATSLTAVYTASNTVNLSWTKPAAATNEMDKVKRFAIYRSTSAPVDMTNANNLLAILWNDAEAYVDNTIQTNTLYYYVVTALDRLHNESQPTNTASVNTVLPVQLLDFTVKKQGANKAELKWVTSNEINFSHFEIEKNSNNTGFGLYKKLAANNSTNTNVYSIEDDLSNASGTINYRIKLMDRDGSFTYSPIRSLAINEKASAIKVYPTMVKRGADLQLSFSQQLLNKVQYRILDAVGRTMQQGNLQTGNATTIIKINNTLASGTYYLQVLINNNTQQSTIVVQ